MKRAEIINIIQLEREILMRSLIKMEMSRYPVFDVIPPNQLPFTDVHTRNHGAATHQSSRTVQQKCAIFNQKKEQTPDFDDVRSDGNPKISSSKKKHIQKYINDLTSEISNPTEEPVQGQTKFKVLKRIIEHYDIKNMEKKDYSKLIQTFGLQIGSATTNQKVTTSQQKRRSFTIKPTTTRGSNRSRLKDRIESAEKDKDREVALLQFSSELIPSYKRNIATSTNSARNSKIVNSELLQKSKNRKELRIFVDGRSPMSKKEGKMSPLKFRSKLDVIVEKVNKYRQFLFALNFSNHLYRDMQLSKYEKPLKYYVGSGNNSNLIKSLLSKRHYFETTNKLKQANFVWTQIKVEHIFEGQEVGSFPTSTKIKLRVSKSPSKDRRSVIIKNGKPTFNVEENLTRIIGKRDANDILNVQEEFNRKNFTCSFEERMKSHDKKLTFSEISENDIVHNHLPSNGLLGNKKGMFYCMREYYKLTNRNIWEILPLTFHITKGLLDPEFKQFQHYYTERKKNKQQNSWIMKPGEFSNRGNGISCSNKLDDIKKRVSQCHSGGRNGKNAKTIILQLYITNPLLYNNRKFDIRTFMLVTCHNGKIKGYWYQEGYIRTSSYFFDLSEMGDNDIHLTNDAIQKQSDKYGKFEPGNKLSYQQLQRYLDSLPSNGRNLDMQSVLIPKMKQIASEALKSSFLFLDRNRRQNNFQIFGLDFMVDYSFNPWLIEINTNPCLELSCPLLERIIPHMVENAFRIGLDTIFPPPDVVPHNYKYTIAENALHYNKFEAIFDQNIDGEKVKLLYQEAPAVAETISSLMNIQEDQEVFEEEGILCDYDI